MRWYFLPSLWLPLKLAVLAWLVYALLFSLFNGGLRALAAMTVLWAVPASGSKILAAIVVVMFAPFTVAFMLSPVVVYGLQIAAIPDYWSRDRGKRNGIIATIGTLLVGYIIAVVLAWVGSTAIGWIADINPCASLRAGVTGSRVPEDCR